LQKKANLHFALTLDLFGNEISTNAANVFNAGIKGRFQEDRLTDDHLLTSSTYPVARLRDGTIVMEDVPALSALNMRLRDDYVADAAAGLVRWNRVLQASGLDFRITLPHVAFNRRIGEFASVHADIQGTVMDAALWEACKETMLPSDDDNRFIEGLMVPVRTPGAFAGWIAPPRNGVDGKPGDFEYVKIDG